jgi:NADH-quinone oxidoreductase subunit C
VEERGARLEPLKNAAGPQYVTDKPAEENPMIQKLRAWDGKAVAETSEFRGELTIVLPPAHLRRAAEYLQAERGLQFDFLSDISAVDRFPMEPRFELNYHLLSIPLRRTVRLRVWLPGKDPVVSTVIPVWPTANWHEREIFDLFGIRFEGHPDLHRILMPDDWEGYPLRKDYPVEGFRT